VASSAEDGRGLTVAEACNALLGQDLGEPVCGPVSPGLSRHFEACTLRRCRVFPLKAGKLVSNGDSISNVQFIHFLIGLVCWFALIFATYPLVRLVVPWRRKSG
jgi:hypothetical protein